MARPKKIEKPMQAIKEAPVHTVKTLLDPDTLRRLRIAMAEDGRSIVEFVRQLIVEALDERDKAKR